MEDRLRRLEALVVSTAIGYLIEDGARRIDLVNERYLEMFEIPASPEQLVAKDGVELASRSAEMSLDPVGFRHRTSQLASLGRPSKAERVELIDGRVLERDYLPVRSREDLIGHLWAYRDITSSYAAVTRADALTQTLSDVWQLQQEYLIENDGSAAYEDVLARLLSSTGAAMGFLAECDVVEGRPVLVARALTDVSWDAASQQRFRDHQQGGFVFDELDSLYGYTLTEQVTVISNEPEKDPRAAGVPKGHPRLRNYLGMPLFAGAEMVGMVGLADRPGGFDEALVVSLEPILTTVAAVLSADRGRRVIEEDRAASDENAKAMSTFLSTASHELRTPLNGVVGFAELLAKEALTGEQRRWVEQLQLSATHLVDLVTRVLDLTRLESGAPALSNMPVSLASVVQATAAGFEAEAAARGVTIANEVGDELAVGDPLAIREVVTNLLDNALKFAVSRVQVATLQEGNTVLMLIGDDGPGVPEADRLQVFQPFGRARDTGSGGAGLGLSLVKGLVEAMAGSVAIGSTPTGGALVTVALPSAADVVGREGGPEFEELAASEGAADAWAGSVPWADGDLDCERVLHVEDNLVNAELMRAIFSRAFPSVVIDTVGTLSEAVAAVASHRYGLVLLDLRLADGSSGLDLLPVLPEPRPRVVLISAESEARLARAATLPGIATYLSKPVTLDSLVAAITGG